MTAYRQSWHTLQAHTRGLRRSQPLQNSRSREAKVLPIRKFFRSDVEGIDHEVASTEWEKTHRCRRYDGPINSPRFRLISHRFYLSWIHFCRWRLRQTEWRESGPRCWSGWRRASGVACLRPRSWAKLDWANPSVDEKILFGYCIIGCTRHNSSKLGSALAGTIIHRGASGYRGIRCILRKTNGTAMLSVLSVCRPATITVVFAPISCVSRLGLLNYKIPKNDVISEHRDEIFVSVFDF